MGDFHQQAASGAAGDYSNDCRHYGDRFGFPSPCHDITCYICTWDLGETFHKIECKFFIVLNDGDTVASINFWIRIVNFEFNVVSAQFCKVLGHFKNRAVVHCET